ncbi:MAG: redoxin domain-containing protein [Promethearchaeota archaeon]|nr:MAG: redoxin domain-containing protein [Candidatus Lokiarchaeota archaeon]
MLKGLKKATSIEALDFPENLEWINTSEPLTLKKLKGHVILLDFWTYCCINCIHVLNDLRYLEDKYKNDPVIVIGVHSAKFNNEKDKDNIRSAVSRYEIKHPVLIDNDLILWRGYRINAWPSFIVIGTDGKVMGRAAGEGKRDLLDNFISRALKKGKNDGTISSQKYEIQPDIFIESFLKFPGKITVDPQENHLYISDSNHNRIVKVQLEEDEIGKVLNIIGNGQKGFKDSNFDEAQFNLPQGIAYRDKKLYVADTENHLIREINFNTNIVKTIAGTGKQGFIRNYNGDPLNISLSSPWDLAINEQFLYIAMAGTHQIWVLDLDKNIIRNFAGSGREDIIDGELDEAALAQPSGLALDKENYKLYFADSEVSGLRFIDLKNKLVKTLIGKGLFKFGMKEGPFNQALLQHPLGVDVEHNRIYIADTYNHAIRIADLETQQLTNLIFRPRKGICKIGDKNCDQLPLFEPNDVVYYNNKLYIADTNNHLIRIFDFKDMKLKDLYIY